MISIIFLRHKTAFFLVTRIQLVNMKKTCFYISSHGIRRRFMETDKTDIEKATGHPVSYGIGYVSYLSEIGSGIQRVDIA